MLDNTCHCWTEMFLCHSIEISISLERLYQSFPFFLHCKGKFMTNLEIDIICSRVFLFLKYSSHPLIAFFMTHLVHLICKGCLNFKWSSPVLFYRPLARTDWGGVQDPQKCTFWAQKVNFLNLNPINLPTKTPFLPILWLKLNLLSDLGGVVPPGYGHALVYEGGYHPQQIHIIRVIFEDQIMYSCTLVRGETCKIGGNGCVFGHVYKYWCKHDRQEKKKT